jgi:hypothetical protein
MREREKEKKRERSSRKAQTPRESTEEFTWEEEAI